MTNISLPYDVSENPVAIYNRIAHTHITIIDNGNRDIKCLEIVNCTFSDLVLNIGIIDKLIIKNFSKYYHTEYEQLFDKVKNNGIVEINNIIVGKLDCDRFCNVRIDSCVILNLIDNSNIASIDMDVSKIKMCDFSIVCNNYNNRFKIIEYENGIYCGEVSYDGDKKMSRHGYGRMTYLSEDRLIDVYEGKWYNDRESVIDNDYSITYTINSDNKDDRGMEGTRIMCKGIRINNYYGRFMNVRINNSKNYSHTITIPHSSNIEDVINTLRSNNFN